MNSKQNAENSVSQTMGVIDFAQGRSRLFLPPDNRRNSGCYAVLQRPGWAPPPLALPVVWMSFAVLRVVSAYRVWSALGQTFLYALVPCH